MSQYRVTTVQLIESDDLALEDVIAYFDNQADPKVEIEVEMIDESGEIGTMQIIESDATGEITEY